ncbi:MAG: VOC family protein [Solirubrobacteraceae bacterium]
MGERTSHPPGSFCWVDLETGDREAAQAFYGEVLGWEFEDLPGAAHAMAHVGGRPVAAVGPLADASEPARFNCYVSVASADDAAARARALGGQVLLAPGDVGPAGRMAILADPQGARFSVWQPGRHVGAGIVNVPGALTWNDLVTTDIDDAERFYGALFGWTLEAASEDPPYEVIHLEAGRANGGMLAAEEGQPPAWLAYFATDDVAAGAARAEGAGAAVINGPAEVPAGGFVVLRDPQGAVFCLFGGGAFED